jgi:hypothetical protein
MLLVAAFVRYMRANPQVLALLLICVILGLGTFVAVLVGLLQAGNAPTSGDPSGVIAPVLGTARALSGAPF